MSLGMLGTLVGFLLLLGSAFNSQLNLQDVDATRNVLQEMAVGFSTAAVTTVVGLVCSLVLKLQIINLEYQVDDEDDYGEDDEA